jgi:hypothetical protein
MKTSKKMEDNLKKEMEETSKNKKWKMTKKNGR